MSPQGVLHVSTPTHSLVLQVPSSRNFKQKQTPVLYTLYLNSGEHVTIAETSQEIVQFFSQKKVEVRPMHKSDIPVSAHLISQLMLTAKTKLQYNSWIGARVPC